MTNARRESSRKTALGNLATTIRQARESKQLSIRQLALQVGINMSNLVRLEKGEVAEPRPALLNEIARVLELNNADLYALAGYTTPATLPALTPYLRSKFSDMPVEARAEVERSFEQIAKKYGYDPTGPNPGEDEN